MSFAFPLRRPPAQRPLRVLGLALVAAGALGAALGVELRKQRRRTARLHRSLIDLLLNALTADDRVTARHSRRVASLTDVLADELSLDRKQRAALRVAALLHDMGKIEEAFFHIVHSRKRLSDAQQRRIQHHPARSAHILRPLERVHPGITETVAAHHERWDGQGYPRQLAGNDIPLGARLIAMADSFDAMTQPRGYQTTTDPAEALAEIRQGAGCQFDPHLAELLDRPRVRERWLEIARKGRRTEERELHRQGRRRSERRSNGNGRRPLEQGEDRRLRFAPGADLT